MEPRATRASRRERRGHSLGTGAGSGDRRVAATWLNIPRNLEARLLRVPIPAFCVSRWDTSSAMIVPSVPPSGLFLMEDGELPTTIPCDARSIPNSGFSWETADVLLARVTLAGVRSVWRGDGDTARNGCSLNGEADRNEWFAVPALSGKLCGAVRKRLPREGDSARRNRFRWGSTHFAAIRSPGFPAIGAGV